jgi:tetratricopeptide (TPR) repeat protein
MWYHLKSLFQHGQPDERFEQALATIEEPMDVAARDYPPKLLARAGEQCVKAGNEPRALACFGCAIDLYLELGCFDDAVAVCRRVVELYPRVVRARCTLAFLKLGQALPHQPFQELIEDARREIGAYVGAAHFAGHQELAAKRLRLMASVTDRHELRELLGEYLLDLGDHLGADEVFEVIHAERNQPQPPAARDQRERWALALRVPVASATSPTMPPAAV